MSANYAWMKFYEAAVLETNPESLPSRIEVAQNAIGQRVITLAIDEAERGAIVKTLNALAILKRERPSRSICHQCRDAHDLVTSMNGRTFLAKTGMDEMKVTLHARCVNAWAETNSFRLLYPCEDRALRGNDNLLRTSVSGTRTGRCSKLTQRK